MRRLSKLKVLIIVALLAISLNSYTYATEIQPVETITESESTSNASAQEITAVEGNSEELNNETPVVIEEEVPVGDIPDAGKEDTILIALISIATISAMYTFRKLRKYDRI